MAKKLKVPEHKSQIEAFANDLRKNTREWAENRTLTVDRSAP